jgi:hypothetical protein
MKVLVQAVLLTILVAGLGTARTQLPENYSRALEHGLTTIPAARQFQELFPNSRNSYAYYWGVKHAPELQCQTILYSRYELTLQIQVKFDGQRSKVISFGEPVFLLKEIKGVTLLNGGRADIRSGDLQNHFGAIEWKKVYQARGDFSILGLKLVRDNPVANLDTWWNQESRKF